jgi:hypothetical protein
VCILAEALKIKIAERDDIADLLALIPPWFVGAVFWVAISELVLKRLYPDDFIKLQAAIIAADVVGDMPPGVAMVAVMYNTLYLVEVKEELTGAFIDELVKTANKIIIGISKFTGL